MANHQGNLFNQPYRLTVRFDLTLSCLVDQVPVEVFLGKYTWGNNSFIAQQIQDDSRSINIIWKHLV